MLAEHIGGSIDGKQKLPKLHGQFHVIVTQQGAYLWKKTQARLYHLVEPLYKIACLWKEKTMARLQSG